MKTHIQSGDSVTVPAPHTVVAGDGVLVGRLFGVALHEAEQGVDVTIDLRADAFALSKVSEKSFAAFDPVYFDAERGLCSGSGNKRLQIGVALRSARKGDARVCVLVGRHI